MSILHLTLTVALISITLIRGPEVVLYADLQAGRLGARSNPNPKPERNPNPNVTTQRLTLTLTLTLTKTWYLPLTLTLTLTLTPSSCVRFPQIAVSQRKLRLCTESGVATETDPPPPLLA